MTGIKTAVNSLLHKDEGSGLILALMTLMVLSVLGASLGAVTIGGFRLSSVNRDTTSAYYIAEAGVNQAYEEMKTIVLGAYDDSSNQSSFFQKIDAASSSMNGRTIDGFSNQFGDTPKAIVQVERKNGDSDNTKTYTLTSEGTVDNKSRVVEKKIEVRWVEKEANVQLPVLPMNASVIAKNQIDFLGGSINGDIYLDSGIKSSFNLGEWGTINSQNIYYDPLINVSELFTAPNWRINNPDPSYVKILEKTKPINQSIQWDSFKELINLIQVPDYSGYEILSKTSYVQIDNDSYISSFNLTGGNRTVINTENTVTNLVINNFNIEQGFIDLKGTGTVNIFVLNKFNIGGDSIINTNARSEQLNLYYMGDSSISLGGAQLLNGNLFVKSASVTYTGSGNINGATVTGGSKVEINGGSINNTLIIAPADNSEILITGSGTVKGALVTSKLNMKGGSVEYSSFDMSRLPFKSTEQESNDPPTNIIISEPVTEQ